MDHRPLLRFIQNAAIAVRERYEGLAPPEDFRLLDGAIEVIKSAVRWYPDIGRRGAQEYHMGCHLYIAAQPQKLKPGREKICRMAWWATGIAAQCAGAHPFGGAVYRLEDLIRTHIDGVLDEFSDQEIADLAK